LSKKIGIAAALCMCLGVAGAQQGSAHSEVPPHHAGTFEGGLLTQGGVGLTDNRGGFRFFMAGVHAGKVLTDNFAPGPLRGNFEYAVELFPFWQSYTPVITRQNCVAVPGAAGTVQSSCSAPFSVGGTYTGVSITPIILRWNFASSKRWAPWVQGAGAVIWTNHKYPPFGGPPVSNGDRQNSTAYLKSQGAAYPNGVDITQDGHFVIFGDTATSENVEVSDMSSGKLGKTIVYGSGAAINSSNLLLSPDESLLFVSNTQGDQITAAFFDRKTGRVSGGCTSNRLKGYGTAWAYLGSLALGVPNGSGGAVYVAEFGPESGIGIVQLSVSAGRCSLAERAKSPVLNPDSTGLLSISTFPPRSF